MIQLFFSSPHPLPPSQDLHFSSAVPEGGDAEVVRTTMKSKRFVASIVTAFVGYLLVHVSIRTSNFELYLTALHMVASLKSQNNKQRYSHAIAETLALVIREGRDSLVYQSLRTCVSLCFLALVTIRRFWSPLSCLFQSGRAPSLGSREELP